MIIEYDKIKREIIIADYAWWTKFSFYFLFVVLILQTWISLGRKKYEFSEFGYPEYFLILVSILSAVALLIYFRKHTFKKRIPFNEVKALEHTVFLWNKRHYILLNNGKKRVLKNVKTQKDIEDIKKLFEELKLGSTK